MKRKVVRLTESDLHRIIKNSVKRILKEATEEPINTPDIRIYAPGPDCYVDVNNSDGEHEGAYLAMISQYDEDSFKTGCHVSYYPWLKSHPKAYKDLIKKLKAIEADETYRLGPRSTVERMEMEENGITWENGHYYKDGKKLN